MVRFLFGVVLTLVVDANARPAKAQQVNGKLDGIHIDTTPQSVGGVVVDEGGRPIAGVRVEARTPVVGFHSSFSMPTGGDSFKPPRVAVTDERGRFSIADIPLWGAREVQLSLRSKHRHVNDANYPVAQDLIIEMSGSGKPGVIQARLVGLATDHPIVPFDDVRVVRRHVARAHTIAIENGRFVLPDELTLGNDYMIYVYAKGYAATAARVTAVSAESEEYQEIMLPARPPLRGKLIDPQTGDAIEGAAILYGVADDASYFQWSDFKKYVDGYHSLDYVQHETSNDSGEFWFAEVNDQTRGTLFVLKERYQRFVLRPELRPIDPRSGDLLIPVPRESVFTGVVMQDGKPVANAGVSVQPRERKDKMEQWYPHVRTDQQGRYRFGGLPPDYYTVFAGPYARRAAIGEAETVELNFGDDLGDIRIEGKAPPRASVHIRPEFDWGYTNFETNADDAGRFECRGLRAGKYTALVIVPRLAEGLMSHHYYVPEFDVSRDGQQVDLMRKRDRRKRERAPAEPTAGGLYSAFGRPFPQDSIFGVRNRLRQIARNLEAAIAISAIGNK